MSPGAAYRGQPLVALLLLIGGWVAVRMMILDAGGPGLPRAQRPGIAMPERLEAPDAPDAAMPPAFGLRLPVDPPTQHGMPPAFPAALPAPRDPPQFRPALPVRGPLAPAWRLAPNRTAPVTPAVPVPIATAHQMLWMAALAKLALPRRAPAAALQAEPVASTGGTQPHGAARWSADAWLLLRRGGDGTAAGGLALPSYGASQAGAVLRYRLVPQSAHRPSLYGRASAALNGSREREAAFGASARPVAGLPVVLAAEARINAQPAGTHVRPAAFAYTELAPLALPLGARAEAYGQAGYVGGNFASAFAEGQVRVDRRIMGVGEGELRAGGGAWAGAQKGASRLDVGPTATLGLPLGGSAGARVGVDWRFRVAGNAAPSSGPALTLSAGF